jgi:hypothetical protein
MRSWPLLVLAAPAAAEVWSGWVGIAQKTGFGLVSPLPGIWPSLHLDTTITLPVGVEAYAAYALRAWLATEHAVSQRTRRFAMWSAICSFALGMAGQAAYHLLDQAGAARAPWAITTIVSCLPVLAMGTALAHMLRADTAVADASGGEGTDHDSHCLPARSSQDQATTLRDQTTGRRAARSGPQRGARAPARPDRDGHYVTSAPGSRTVQQLDAGQACLITSRLAAAGIPVSRRALRSIGVRGSNEALNSLARKIKGDLTSAVRPADAACTQHPANAGLAGDRLYSVSEQEDGGPIRNRTDRAPAAPMAGKLQAHPDSAPARRPARRWPR